MLERGTMNLSRFLRERLNRPPENFDELRALWRAIFEPVKPLRKLHSIPMNDEHEIKAHVFHYSSPTLYTDDETPGAMQTTNLPTSSG